MGLAARLGIISRIHTSTTNPPAGSRLLYAKGDGWYDRTSDGIEAKIGAGEGGNATILSGGRANTTYASNAPLLRLGGAS